MSEDGNSKKPNVHHLNPRRRKKLKQGKADVTPEELARRQEQQRRREIALKLRSEGRTYNPRVFKRKQFSGEGGPAHKKVRVKVKSSQRNKQPYHVVILPIAWKQRREEAASIDAACQAAAQHLREAGITLTIDETDTYTPGQKMKFWEQRGVKVRLEIGPKEALAGTAILALATTPGQVAQKQSVKVKPEVLVAKVKEALEKQGVDLSGLKPAPGAGGGSGAAGAADGSQADGQGKQQVKAKTPRKRPAEEQEEEGQAGAQQDTAAAEGAEPAGKKKKKKKHLVEDGEQAMAVAEQLAHSGGSNQSQHAGKQQKQKQQEPAEAPPQQQQQQQKAKVAPKQQQQQMQMHTGDELEDDFGELLDEPVVAGGEAGKKQKNKKQREGEPSAAAGGFGGAPAAHHKPAGVKKHKVVKF